MLKCYLKPARKERRVFKTCDAVRICREVLAEDAETTPEELLACIAKSLGFTHISLSRVRTVQSGALARVSAALLLKGVIIILDTIIKAVEAIQALLSRFPFVSRVIVVIELLLEAKRVIEKIVDIFSEPPPDQVPVNEALNPNKCNCKPTIKKSVDNVNLIVVR